MRIFSKLRSQLRRNLNCRKTRQNFWDGVLVENPYNPKWQGECVALGQGPRKGSFVMLKDGRLVSIRSFIDFSSDFLSEAGGDPNNSIDYYAKKFGIKISDFEVDNSAPTK